MNLRLIRNATLRLSYGGIEFLIDPMLSVKRAIRPMGDSAERNPTVELPCPINEVLDGVDTVLVSHLHPDHFDEAAFGLVPRHLPLLCQPGDLDRLTIAGFHATELADTIKVGDVSITPTAGRHGHGPIVERMGNVIGILFRCDTEPTMYWVGDSVLSDEVRATIERERPDVIVTHSGGATAEGTEIIMGIADTIAVAQLAPTATVIAVHLEAVAHAPVTRQQLRAAASRADITPDRLRIPDDGDTINVVSRRH